MQNITSFYFKIIVLISLILFSCGQKKKFNSDVWKNGSKFSEREKMVDDLISSKILLGKNKEQIINTLGEPLGNGEEKICFLVNVEEKNRYIVPVTYNQIYLTISLDSQHVASKITLEESGEFEE